MVTLETDAAQEFADGSPMENRADLVGSRVLAVQLSGSAGSGKTALLETTIKSLHGRARVGVIVAHRAAERDADRLRHSAIVVAVETAQLNPALIRDALRQLDLHELDILFIETPDDEPIDLGENARIALFSVSGGDDKAAEFPQRVAGADLVILGKTDLLPLVQFDPSLFRDDVTRINATAELIQLSTRDGSGIDHWTRWLLDRRQRLQDKRPPNPSMPEWWFG